MIISMEESKNLSTFRIALAYWIIKFSMAIVLEYRIILNQARHLSNLRNMKKNSIVRYEGLRTKYENM